MKLDDSSQFKYGKNSVPNLIKYGIGKRKLKASARRNIKANYCVNYWSGILAGLAEIRK